MKATLGIEILCYFCVAVYLSDDIYINLATAYMYGKGI